MRTFICFAFLGMACICHAQKASKNEFSLGYFPAGYFFDSTGVKFSQFIRGKNITLSYTRHVDKHWSFNTSSVRSSFGYIMPPAPDYLKDNTVVYRYLKAISGSVGYRISKWSMSAKLKTGVNYQFKFEKYVHLTYFDGGNWREPRSVTYMVQSIGPTLGLTLTHPIVWKLCGEFDCQYARMFSKYNIDPNQLLLSYRVGIRF